MTIDCRDSDRPGLASQNMKQAAPFHAGELAVQGRAGVKDLARRTVRMIRNRLFAGTHAFIERQPLVLCASLDRQHNVWASMVQGDPGFLRACDDRTLEIRPDPARLDVGDPLWNNIRYDRRIGLLFIEFGSRRRLRVNGTVSRLGPDGLRITVHACYPNCPKYIQQRRTTGLWRDNRHPGARTGTELTNELTLSLQQADTAFVASAHPEAGADLSHRGGNPGFIDIVNSKTLRIPDYAGNNLFNTLGNFQSYPHAGLLVPDFRSGRVLQLIGRPQIEWDPPSSQLAAAGAHRSWLLHIAAWRLVTLPAYLDWRFIDYSPHLPPRDIAAR